MLTFQACGLKEESSIVACIGRCDLRCKSVFESETDYKGWCRHLSLSLGAKRPSPSNNCTLRIRHKSAAPGHIAERANASYRNHRSPRLITPVSLLVVVHRLDSGQACSWCCVRITGQLHSCQNVPAEANTRRFLRRYEECHIISVLCRFKHSCQLVA